MTTKNLPKVPKVYKNKKLNNANFGDFNLNEYQVFLMLIAKLGKIDQNGDYLQSEKLEREHTLTALEFAHHFNLDVKHAYRVLKKAGTKMMKSFITIEMPELQKTWLVGITSFAEYNHQEGSITIKFTEEIMPYLAQVKEKFVLYNLKEIANFGSLYTTRLYELLQDFKDTGILLISVEKLRIAFAVAEKFKLYGLFKQYTFAHACSEINEKTDYIITFEEIKTGRKVTAIEFNFKLKKVQKVMQKKLAHTVAVQEPKRTLSPVAAEALQNMRAAFLPKIAPEKP